MKNSIVTLVTFASVCAMFIGGCGIMNEMGNIQWGAVALALFGTANLVFISRRVDLENI